MKRCRNASSSPRCGASTLSATCAAEPQVKRPVDDGHAAAPDLLLDLIARELFARNQAPGVGANVLRHCSRPPVAGLLGALD